MYPPATWQHQIATSRDRWLWDRGLAPDPSRRYAVRAQEEAVGWQLGPEASALFSGDVATDGSRLGSWQDLGRTGAAAVQLEEGGLDVAVVAWGPMPVYLPVQRRIARAELYAVLLVLRSCLPPLRIHVDCEIILKGVAAGQRWCTHSGRPHADVWKMLWHHIEDVGQGPEGVTFYKGKAHVSKAKVAAADLAAQRIYIANGHADGWAKQGASIGVNEMLEFIDQAVTEQAKRVKGALDHMAALAAAVLPGKTGWPDVVAPPKVEPKAAAPRPPPVPVRKHRWAPKPFGQQCLDCCRVARSAEHLDALNKASCEGHAVARLIIDDLGPYITVHGHRLWQTGHYVWCAACGCYTTKRIQGLAKQCRGGIAASARGIVARHAKLAAGRDPCAKVSAPPLGRPTRLTLGQWLRWKGLLKEDIDTVEAAECVCSALDTDAVLGDEDEGALA